MPLWWVFSYWFGKYFWSIKNFGLILVFESDWGRCFRLEHQNQPKILGKSVYEIIQIILMIRIWLESGFASVLHPAASLLLQLFNSGFSLKYFPPSPCQTSSSPPSPTRSSLPSPFPHLSPSLQWCHLSGLSLSNVNTIYTLVTCCWAYMSACLTVCLLIYLPACLPVSLMVL